MAILSALPILFLLKGKKEMKKWLFSEELKQLSDEIDKLSY